MSATARHAVPLELDPGAFFGFDRAARVTRLAGEAMGTGWSIRLAEPPGFDTEQVARVVERLLDRLVAEMSHWSPTSLLSRFNRSEGGAWTALPPDFAAVMATALDIAARSGGAFDPAIGRLTDLWGLGPNPVATPPSAAAIEEARSASGWRRLALDPAGPTLRQPGGVWLDLSGIAKGYAADAIAALIVAAGVRHALVEIGGECVGLGLRPDGDPWWVELETPPGIALPPLRVALHQMAVATSGDYVRGRHTLASRTGAPVAHDTAAVSVLHRSAMHADAWATALTVLAPDAALTLATRESLAVRIVARSGREWLSPALAAML